MTAVVSLVLLWQIREMCAMNIRLCAKFLYRVIKVHRFFLLRCQFLCELNSWVVFESAGGIFNLIKIFSQEGTSNLECSMAHGQGSVFYMKGKQLLMIFICID